MSTCKVLRLVSMMVLLLAVANTVDAAGRHVAQAGDKSKANKSGAQSTSEVVHPDDMSYVSSQCRGSSFVPWSFYGRHVVSVLADLVQNTPYADGFTYKTRTPGQNAPAFGYAGCSTTLTSQDDCQACLSQATTDILSLCNYAIAARLRYQDCWVRYEDHYFNGGMIGN